MLVSVHLIAFLVNEYFTPEWQRQVRDITREVVECFHDAVPAEATQLPVASSCRLQFTLVAFLLASVEAIRNFQSHQ